MCDKHVRLTEVPDERCFAGFRPGFLEHHGTICGRHQIRFDWMPRNVRNIARESGRIAADRTATMLRKEKAEGGWEKPVREKGES